MKQRALALMEQIRILESDEFVNSYIHCAVFHLPDQILRCPIDVNDASGASIEHIHQPVKRAFMYVVHLSTLIIKQTMHRHGTNRHHRDVSRKHKRTRTRAAQALVTCYSSVQVKNPSIRAIIRRCAQRRLKRIGQEGRKPAKLVKLESQFKPSEIFVSSADTVPVGEPVHSEKTSDAAASAQRSSARAPMNAQERRQFKKDATERMKKLKKQRSKK